jgi:hypothetical protein
MMTRLPIIALLGWMICCSCNQPRYVYSQNVRNVHFFNDKGQSRASAALTTGPSRSSATNGSNYNRGFDLQGAYAITRNFAATAAYYSRKERDQIQVSNIDVITSDVSYRRSGWELGGSFFLPIDMRSHSFFHIDGGFGQTSNRFTDVGTFDTLGVSRDFANRNIRLFLQPGIYTGNGPVEFGMGVRLQWANFGQVNTNYTPAEQQAYRLSGLGEMQMVEPYAILRFGPASMPGLRFEIQGSFTAPSGDYYTRAGYFSFGVAVDPLSLRR